MTAVRSVTGSASGVEPQGAARRGSRCGRAPPARCRPRGTGRAGRRRRSRRRPRRRRRRTRTRRRRRARRRQPPPPRRIAAAGSALGRRRRAEDPRRRGARPRPRPSPTTTTTTAAMTAADRPAPSPADRDFVRRRHAGIEAHPRPMTRPTAVGVRCAAWRSPGRCVQPGSRTGARSCRSTCPPRRAVARRSSSPAGGHARRPARRRHPARRLRFVRGLHGQGLPACRPRGRVGRARLGRAGPQPHPPGRAGPDGPRPQPLPHVGRDVGRLGGLRPATADGYFVTEKRAAERQERRPRGGHELRRLPHPALALRHGLRPQDRPGRARRDDGVALLQDRLRDAPRATRRRPSATASPRRSSPTARPTARTRRSATRTPRTSRSTSRSRWPSRARS